MAGSRVFASRIIVIDSLNLALASKEADVSLERLTLAKAANTASLQGSYSLPADLKSWDAQPLDLDLAIDAPELSAFVAPESGASLKGTLRIAGKGSARNRIYNGDFVNHRPQYRSCRDCRCAQSMDASRWSDNQARLSPARCRLR